eukprot:gene9477-9557_t
MPLIVLIDDLSTNRAIFGQLAQNLADDIEILTFASAREALNVLRDTMPDLVITDYNMPEMNGAEFIERFRLLPNCADIPVIVITIHGERDWKLAALAAGATDFLSSPVDHLEFATRARNLLQLRRHQLLLEKRLGHLTSRLASSRVSQAHSTQEANRQLEQIINALPVMMSAVDAQGQIIFCNAAHAEFYGVKAQLQTRSARHQRPEMPETELSSHDRVILQSGIVPPPFMQNLKDKSGEVHAYAMHKALLTDRQGRARAVLSSAVRPSPIHIQDQDESAAAVIRHMPLQAQFRQQLQDMMTVERREGQRAALHLVQLTGATDTSATTTPLTINNLIRLTARHISLMLRESDILSQWDETTFAILQRHATGPQDALKFAQRLQLIVQHCSSLIDNNMAGGCAIGIAFAQSGLQNLIQDAQQALKTARAGVSLPKARQTGRPLK